MSVGSYIGERIILREKQLSRSDFERAEKKKNFGENFFHTTYKENYEMDRENLVCKVENTVEDAEPTLNNAFPQRFDSFSSVQHRNDSTFKTEHSPLSSTLPLEAHNDLYPQYLSNYSTIVCVRDSDPFDSCLKGGNTCEVRVKFLSGNDSEVLVESPIKSRIVPTCQRFRDLTDGTTINERKSPRNNVKKKQKISSSQNAKTRTKELNSKKRFKNVSVKPLICTICGAQYSYEIPFTRHVSKHTNAFQCNLCPRSFSSQRSLAIHLRSHERRRNKLSQQTLK